jgi:hypothetical protein
MMMNKSCRALVAHALAYCCLAGASLSPLLFSLIVEPVAVDVSCLQRILPMIFSK